MKRIFFNICCITLAVSGLYASEKSIESSVPPLEKDQTDQKVLTISELAEGTIVETQMIMSGTYSEELLRDKDIWIIIWPEKAPTLGWPQFGDPLKMTPAQRNDGNWSTICSFGGPPQSYKIAVYTSPAAGTLLLQQLCKSHIDSNDPAGGYIIDKELPDCFMKHEERTVSKINKRSTIPKKTKSLLESIQNDIAEGGLKAGESYYKNEYRAIEPFFWYKIAGWMFEDAVEHTVKGESVNKILDLGGGYGTLLIYATFMYGTEGICFDLCNHVYPNVLDKYNISYMKGDIERGSLPQSEKFEVIIMTEVLEHFNFQPVPTLKKIHDILAPGGSFFLSTPDADSIWGRTHKYYKSLSEIPSVDPNAAWIDDHIWQYDSTELISVLLEAGFKIKRFDRTIHPTKEGYKHFNVWLTK